MNLEEFKNSKSKIDYDEYVDKALEKAEKQLDDPNTKYYTHEEVFSMARKKCQLKNNSMKIFQNVLQF